MPEAWTPSARYPDPAIVALDPGFKRYHLALSAVERLWTGSRWGEGPVWIGDLRCLLWSDIPNNRVLKWEETGAVSVWQRPSNNANGHTRDRQGRIIACEHAGRRVVRFEYDGSVTVLADRSTVSSPSLTSGSASPHAPRRVRARTRARNSSMAKGLVT